MTIENDGLGDESAPDPRLAPFGYLGADQFGVKLFRWSADASAAFSSYVNDELLAGLLDDDEDVMDEVSEFHATMKAHGMGLGDVVTRLNELTSGYSTIEWWGTFEQLCNSDGAFEAEFRENWRLDEREEEVETAVARRPISLEEMEDFIEFLAAYGY